MSTRSDKTRARFVVAGQVTILSSFLRDKRISSLKSNWSLSLDGTHDEQLQAALWHACSPTIQSKLTEEGTAGFTVAFDGVIPADGSFCTVLPLDRGCMHCLRHKIERSVEEDRKLNMHCTPC